MFFFVVVFLGGGAKATRLSLYLDFVFSLDILRACAVDTARVHIAKAVH